MNQTSIKRISDIRIKLVGNSAKIENQCNFFTKSRTSITRTKYLEPHLISRIFWGNLLFNYDFEVLVVVHSLS